MPTKGPSFCS